jgi:putative transcriptional regulator
LTAVAANLAALVDVLANPQRWGIPRDRCHVVHDPNSPLAVEAGLREASANADADGLLLIYFAGHGVVDPRSGDLHLAVSGTEADAPYSTAVPYEWVRRSVLGSPAARRVVILDCCYAGRATDGMGTAVDVIADQAEIDRTCVLVASSATRAAIAPADEMYTAFTGVLLDLLNCGVVGGADPLDVATIYHEIVRVQRSRGRPLPELRARNAGDRIPIVRNAARLGGCEADIATGYVGEVLVAGERVSDPELRGATVAVLAHSAADGAIGVRVDRAITRSSADILGERRAAVLEAPPVFDGGPVRDVVILVVLLQPDAPRPAGFRPIIGDLGTVPLGNDLSALVGTLGAAFLFVGYLGWRPGQLEAEVRRGYLKHAGTSLLEWLTDGAHVR